MGGKEVKEHTSMDYGILSDNTIFGRIGLHDFEFDGPHTTANKKCVTLTNGTVGFEATTSEKLEIIVWFRTDLQENRA